MIFRTISSILNSDAEEIKFQAYIQEAWVAFAKDPEHGLTIYQGGWPLYDPVKKSLIHLAYENCVGTNLVFPVLYDANISC